MKSITSQFLSQLLELGEFSIKKDLSSYYTVEVKGIKWALSDFSDDSLFRCLIGLTSQIAIKENWYPK